MDLGERLVDEHLVVPTRLEMAARSKHQAVERSRPRGRDRDQVASGRRDQVVHRQADVLDDSWIRTRNAGELSDLPGDRLWGSLEVHEDVGKPVGLIVQVTRIVEGAPCAL